MDFGDFESLMSGYTEDDETALLFMDTYSYYMEHLTEEEKSMLSWIAEKEGDFVFALCGHPKYINDKYDVRMWYDAEEEYIHFEVLSDTVIYETIYKKHMKCLIDDIKEDINAYFWESLKSFDDIVEFIEHLEHLARSGDYIELRALKEATMAGKITVIKNNKLLKI